MAEHRWCTEERSWGTLLFCNGRMVVEIKDMETGRAAHYLVARANMHDELSKLLDEAAYYVSQCENEGSAGAAELHDKIDALLAKAKGEA